MCNDCYGRGHKQSKRIEGGWEPGDDCYVSRCENGWVFCNECNSYGNGEFLGQCKECKGSGYSN
jgi:RecJ-like exonuclease